MDPFVPVYIVEEYLTAYYAMGDFEKVVAEARNLHHQTRRSRCYTAASLVALGRVDAAREVVRTVLEDDPVLTLDYVRGQEFFRDKQTNIAVRRRYVRVVRVHHQRYAHRLKATSSQFWSTR